MSFKSRKKGVGFITMDTVVTGGTYNDDGPFFMDALLIFKNAHDLTWSEAAQLQQAYASMVQANAYNALMRQMNHQCESLAMLAEALGELAATHS